MSVNNITNNITYTFPILPLSYFYSYEKYRFLETSNKILIPQTILNDINSKYDDELEFPLYYQFLINKENKENKENNENNEKIDEKTDIKISVSYYDAILDINAIYVPKHIFDTLNIEPNNELPITLLKKTLVKGSKCKLQPHSSDFFEIDNYRDYLEKTLGQNYSALTENTTIQLPYYDTIIKLDILKTEPESNISIIDTDLEVEFEKALDYVEPPPLKKTGVGLNFSLNTKAAQKIMKSKTRGELITKNILTNKVTII